jgi:3-hydroxybutyrate dehydrogenase
VASPFKSAYVAAKFGVVGLTKAVGVELARTGVTCNAICPGYVKTPLVEAQIGDQARSRGISEDRVVDEVILAAQPNKAFVEYDHLAGMLLYLVSDMGASATGGGAVRRRRLDGDVRVKGASAWGSREMRAGVA